MICLKIIKVHVVRAEAAQAGVEPRDDLAPRELAGLFPEGAGFTGDDDLAAARAQSPSDEFSRLSVGIAVGGVEKVDAELYCLFTTAAVPRSSTLPPNWLPPTPMAELRPPARPRG